MTPPRPTLRVEKRLLREGRLRVLCADECGRGSLGGPASAGVVVIDASVTRPLRGLRDSKLLTPRAREALVPQIHRWAVAGAVGHATAAEVDALGLTAALRLAAHRAIARLPVQADVVLLDGNHDWLTPPGQGTLFGSGGTAGCGSDPAGCVPAHTVTPDAADPVVADVVVAEVVVPEVVIPEVVTMIKADLHCAGVAAASVLAKVERDALMVGLAAHYPHYGWEENKGYGSPQHLDALRRLGPCVEHRRSWRLPTMQTDG